MYIKIRADEKFEVILKKQMDAIAEEEWWAKLTPAPLPKVELKTKVKKGIIGWYNFTKETLKELKP